MNIFSEKKTENEPDTTAAIKTPISIPLYIGGAVAQLSGLAAVAYQLAEPSFAYFTMLLTVVGLTCSYFLRRMGGSVRLVQSGAILVALMFVAAIRGVGPFQNLVPFEAQGSQELLLVCSLAFTATFCSFLLVTDESVMFTSVWAIAIIGLTGTVNINQELIGCFVVFLAASTFLLVHQNSLAGGMPTITERTLIGEDESVTGGRIRKTATATARWSLLRTQGKVALACAVTAVLFGFLIAIPLQMVGRNLSLANVLQRLNVPAAASQRLNGKNGVIQLDFNNSHDFQVGLGPIGDDQTERAYVQSSKPLYWRGRLFDYYTGSGWANSFIGQNVYSESLTATGGVDKEGWSRFVVKKLPYERKRVEAVRYRFHVNDSRFTPLYVAAEVRQVRLPSTQVTLRRDNTIAAPNNYGQEYEGVSEVPEPKPSELKNTNQLNYPPDVRQWYLQIQENAELEALAARIIADANAQNPYDKAEALRQWISSNCVYTLEAPAVPRGRDAAQYFLTETKQGYCDLYATALTVLCRHAGLPARVATGFAPGVESQDMKATNEKDRIYLLREADRHAWTEIYFEGYGWIVFDATQDTPGTINPVRTPEPKADERTVIERILEAGWLPVTMTLLGLCGFLYFLIMEIWLLVRGKRGMRANAFTVAANSRYVVKQYQNATRQFGRRGMRRSPEMTTSEYLQSVRAKFGDDVGDAFASLTSLFQRAVYGTESGSVLGQEEATAAHNALKRVEIALKEKPRASR